MTTAVLIDSSASIGGPTSRTQVAVSDLVIYEFGDNQGAGDFSYWKTTDGGLTWSAAVTIFGAGAGSQWHDIYYEKWNGASRPNVVHLAYSQDFGSRGIWYRSLNLSNDTLGPAVRALAYGPHPATRAMGLGVGRDGSIRVDGKTTFEPVNGAYSNDGGVVWITTGNSFCEFGEDDRTSVWADFAGADEDLIALFWDTDALELSVKRWDKSLNTITETAIATRTSYWIDGFWSACLDKSNGHIYLAAMEDTDGANTIRTWDIYGGTITARTAVMSATTYLGTLAMTIKPDGKIRCYFGQDDSAASSSSRQIYYKESSDQMVTWGARTLYNTRDNVVTRIVVDPAPSGAIAPTWLEGIHVYIEAPAPSVEPDQYRLMLSDGADPDVPITNITADDISTGGALIRTERGRESAVIGMPSRAGQATAQLTNVSLPYALDEPRPGLALRLNKMYSGTWYHLWQGNLDVPEHAMSGMRPFITLRALGPLTKLAGRKVSTDLYQNVTTGAAIGHLLDAAGFPSFLRDLDPGDVTLPYWWASDEDALSALWTLVNSEGITAELYEAGDGKLVFRSRMARYDETRSSAVQMTFRNTATDPWFHAFDYTAGYREVVNYATHERYRRTNDTGPTVVWSDTPDFYYIVPPNGSIAVEAIASEPFFDAITPVASTDFLYGFDLPTVTLERTSGQRTKITFASGAGGTTLTGLQLRATTTINNATYTEVSTVDNTASVAAYGLRPWGGTMSKELDWADMRDNLDAIVTWKQVPRGRVRFSIDAATGAVANQATAVREIGDRIRVIESALGFDGEVWIERIAHEVRAPAGPTDGTTVGSEVTTYECAVITVAGGSTGTGVTDTSPYPDNGALIGTGLDDDGITMRGASMFG